MNKLQNNKKITELTPIFVKYIPEEVEAGKLYVSMEYATCVHLCACGCGEKVVTPLAPKEWKLNYDGVHVTLCPSIGNFKYSCNSHYFIRGNRIEWVEEKAEKPKPSKKKKWNFLPWKKW